MDRADEGDWASVPSLVPAFRRDHGADSRSGHAPQIRSLSACPELDCVRHLLPPVVLDLAERRAAEAGVGADRVLIAWGLIGEETYVAAMAAFHGIPFEPLFNTPRWQCRLPDEGLLLAANTGMLPLNDHNGYRAAVVPRLVDSRRLAELMMSGADIAQSICLTSTARLHGFVTRHAAPEIERRAADELRLEHPELSAGIGRSRRLAIGAWAATLTLAGIVFPGATMTAIELALGFVFLAWTALRLLGLLSERLVRRHARTFADDKLPPYSIIVGLYREAAAVHGLVGALRSLNYPLEKLDIKLVLEPDDHETRAAVALLRLGPPFEVIVAPPGGPRTKPKALNAALPFVRGKFVAVFDAEDRPEPDQLRLALEAFAAGDERLACVQARLTVDNTADSWLTRGIR